MPGHYHAIVWIDHHEARILDFNADQADERAVHPAQSPQRIHRKAGSPSGTHVTDMPDFFRDVAATLDDAKEILITGPSSAKTEFVKYLAKHAPSLLECVMGIETLAQVTDRQLLAEARRFFGQKDRTLPQTHG
jgi:stalled ribosome rescue protein Dom34